MAISGKWTRRIALLVFPLVSVIGLSAQTLTTLADFNGLDGWYLYEPLTQGLNGNFYGTTYQGGDYGYGNVFEITPTGTLTLCTVFVPPVPRARTAHGPTAVWSRLRTGAFTGPPVSAARRLCAAATTVAAQFSKSRWGAPSFSSTLSVRKAIVLMGHSQPELWLPPMESSTE